MLTEPTGERRLSHDDLRALLSKIDSWMLTEPTGERPLSHDDLRALLS